jgi:hypothetical protein
VVTFDCGPVRPVVGEAAPTEPADEVEESDEEEPEEAEVEA